MDTLRGHIKRIPELLAPKIDTIKTNFDQWKVPWTKNRAEKLDKLDNLDESISTRAPANTALSSGVWTAGRASKLDNLDARVSTRATQTSVNALSQGPKVIRGLASVSVGSTLDDKTINLPQTIDPGYANVSVRLVSTSGTASRMTIVVSSVTSTTIKVKVNRPSSTDATASVEWQVVGGIN